MGNRNDCRHDNHFVRHLDIHLSGVLICFALNHHCTITVSSLCHACTHLPQGDVIGVEADLDRRRLSFSRNGSWERRDGMGSHSMLENIEFTIGLTPAVTGPSLCTHVVLSMCRICPSIMYCDVSLLHHHYRSRLATQVIAAG